jgi:GNAT superfamily N-acetyltransferase
MTTWAIRDAVLSDRPKLRDIFWQASLTNEGDRDAMLSSTEALEPEAFAGRGRVRVATSPDGTIVGFATVCVAELEDLFVDPEWMRQGVAAALVHDAAEYAHREGTPRIDVTANPHALAFYEAVGFVGVSETETPFGTPGVRMHLETGNAASGNAPSGGDR